MSDRHGGHHDRHDHQFAHPKADENVEAVPTDDEIAAAAQADADAKAAAEHEAKAQADVAAMQGLPVQGYRPQTAATVDAVNVHKALEEQSLRVLDAHKGNADVDQDWLQHGRTQIESGWMAVNRAIFKPDRAKLPNE